MSGTPGYLKLNHLHMARFMHSQFLILFSIKLIKQKITDCSTAAFYTALSPTQRITHTIRPSRTVFL